MPLPAWLATTVQVPSAIGVMLVPLLPVDDVQTDGVVIVNVTAKPEVAVAETLTAGCDSLRLARAPNVIVCGAFVTTKLWLTEGAAP